MHPKNSTQSKMAAVVEETVMEITTITINNGTRDISITVPVSVVEQIKNDPLVAQQYFDMVTAAEENAVKCDQTVEFTEESTNQDAQSEKANSSNFKWENDATMLLLHLYQKNMEQFESKTIPKKQVWIKINKQMLKRGFKTTWEQLDSKWKGLLKTYRRIKSNSADQSDRTRKEWEYYDVVDDVVNNRPINVSNVGTLLSTDLNQVSLLDSPSNEASGDADDVASPPMETQNGDESADDDVGLSGSAYSFKWENTATTMLLKLYEEHRDDFDSKKTPKKHVWMKINEDMLKKGFNTNWEQLDTKWKGLIKMYKKIRESVDQTGSAKREWEYYEIMDNLCRDKIDLTSGSSMADTVPTSSDQKRPKNSQPHKSYQSNPDFDYIPARTFRLSRKRRFSRLCNLSEILERHHREKMARQDRFLDLMSKFLEKI